MSEQLLNILKLCLLALIYLFLARVLRAVWTEIGAPRAVDAGRRGRRGGAVIPVGPTAGGPPIPAGPTVPAAPPQKRGRKQKGAPTELVVVEPPEDVGRRYPLGAEITVGRAAGCQVTIDDTYVSQLHARVFTRDGQLMVEDLGSTNGTYLNRAKVAGATVMQKGDRLQVGNTVLEVT